MLSTFSHGTIRPVKPSFRFVAALWLALILPVQGMAAASAEISLEAQATVHDAVMADADESDGHHHCDDSTGPGDGKCCNGHTFMTEAPGALAAVFLPSFEHRLYVARWTNFIPEEPSPPPIVSSAID